MTAIRLTFHPDGDGWADVIAHTPDGPQRVAIASRASEGWAVMLPRVTITATTLGDLRNAVRQHLRTEGKWWQ